LHPGVFAVKLELYHEQEENNTESKGSNP
jgi:hypothetical protein